MTAEEIFLKEVRKNPEAKIANQPYEDVVRIISQCAIKSMQEFSSLQNKELSYKVKELEDTNYAISDSLGSKILALQQSNFAKELQIKELERENKAYRLFLKDWETKYNNIESQLSLLSKEKEESGKEKYYFAREIIFNLRSCQAINEKVYLHWIDKLNKDETTETQSTKSEKGEGE